MSVFLLEPFSQNYDWGKLGSSSVVSQLIQAGYSISIDESKPYAELWMGDHVNGLNKVIEKDSKIPISKFLTERNLSGKIHFLFKVLSVRKSLSIQSHPDANLAQQLHAQHPTIYKDPNPKPELAIALTPFRALFGFRPFAQIIDFLNQLPPLTQIIPLSHQSSLKQMYSTLMKAPVNEVERRIEEILNLDTSNLSSDCKEAVELARNLHTQFPGGDVGVLSVFLLNIVDLEPGQCLFMGPNVPHAYITGDLIECMTSSDNVIRGGLTPKFKDVDTLVASLDYTCTIPELLEPRIVNGGFPSWSPPGVPFAVTRITLAAGSKTVEFQSSLAGPSIALVMRGDGRIDDLDIKKGQSVLILPGMCISVHGGEEGLDLFLAFTP